MSGDSSEGQPFVIVADARRRWTRAEKQAIVAECGVDRASVSAVARKHNIATSLLFRWRRELGPARTSAEAQPAFVAVGLPAPVGTAVGNGGLIEIELSGGRRVRVAGAVDVVALRRVIEVLDGR
jgi:transposase